MCRFSHVDYHYLSDKDVNINHIFLKNSIDIIDVICYFIKMNFVFEIFIEYYDILFFKVRIS